MALRMPGPVKHSSSGVYQLRVRVPLELRALVGKGEVVKSLGTRDSQVAKMRYVQERAALYARWANLRSGPKLISESEADELVAHVFHRWFDQYRDNFTEQKFWATSLFQNLWQRRPVDWKPGTALSYGSFLTADLIKVRQMQKWCEESAKSLTAQQGLILDQSGIDRIAKAIARAVQGASLALERLARGEREPTGHPAIIQQSSTLKPRIEVATDPVPFEHLVDGWAAEKNPAAKTAYEWRRVIRQLCAFLGHDDAARVTSSDLNSWKSQLVDAGLKAKTIRDAQLAPVRAVFRWAVENSRISTNPAERITISVRLKPGESRRGFGEEEAAFILQAALGAKNPVCRWVPWICAYTGARVSEVCQLRKIDVMRVDEIWCIKFDPAAGSLKNRSSERTVPLHKALLESGFIDFVNQVADGPIFSELRPDKWGNRGGNATKILGKWIRSIGLTDLRLAPNHSWRHRLKTAARRHGLAPDLVDAICGHSPQSVGDRYGEYPMAALLRELEKLPAILPRSSQDAV